MHFFKCITQCTLGNFFKIFLFFNVKMENGFFVSLRMTCVMDVSLALNMRHKKTDGPIFEVVRLVFPHAEKILLRGKVLRSPCGECNVIFLP